MPISAVLPFAVKRPDGNLFLAGRGPYFLLGTQQPIPQKAPCRRPTGHLCLAPQQLPTHQRHVVALALTFSSFHRPAITTKASARNPTAPLVRLSRATPRILLPSYPRISPSSRGRFAIDTTVATSMSCPRRMHNRIVSLSFHTIVRPVPPRHIGLDPGLDHSALSPANSDDVTLP